MLASFNFTRWQFPGSNKDTVWLDKSSFAKLRIKKSKVHRCSCPVPFLRWSIVALPSGGSKKWTSRNAKRLALRGAGDLRERKEFGWIFLDGFWYFLDSTFSGHRFDLVELTLASSPGEARPSEGHSEWEPHFKNRSIFDVETVWFVRRFSVAKISFKAWQLETAIPLILAEQQVCRKTWKTCRNAFQKVRDF